MKGLEISTEARNTYTSQKGCEFVVCNTTGKGSATQAGLARILEMPESTLRHKLNARNANNDSNGLQPILPVEGLVKYTDSNSSTLAKLYSAKDVFLLALDYNPKVAEAMAEGGANMYILHLAGYQAKLVIPEPVKPQNQALTNIEWAKAYILQETQKLNIEQFLGMKRMIDHLQTETKETDIYPPFSVYAYLVNEDCLELLDKKLFNTFNRRVASLYRVCHQKNPMRANCVLTGKRANLYTESDLVILEQAFDTLDI